MRWPHKTRRVIQSELWALSRRGGSPRVSHSPQRTWLHHTSDARLSKKLENPSAARRVQRGRGAFQRPRTRTSSTSAERLSFQFSSAGTGPLLRTRRMRFTGGVAKGTSVHVRVGGDERQSRPTQSSPPSSHSKHLGTRVKYGTHAQKSACALQLIVTRPQLAALRVTQTATVTVTVSRTSALLSRQMPRSMGKFWSTRSIHATGSAWQTRSGFKAP